METISKAQDISKRPWDATPWAHFIFWNLPIIEKEEKKHHFFSGRILVYLYFLPFELLFMSIHSQSLASEASKSELANINKDWFESPLAPPKRGGSKNVRQENHSWPTYDRFYSFYLGKMCVLRVLPGTNGDFTCFTWNKWCVFPVSPLFPCFPR